MRCLLIMFVNLPALFSIPSKVEMAEEQKYLWYYFWMLSLLIETCVAVFRLILCAIWFTALVKCKSFLWSGKRIYAHAHKRACLLRVVCYKFKRSFTWIINLCAHLLFLFTSWMVHKFFIWASTDPWTNIFNSCIVWLLSTTTGSLTANWIISVDQLPSLNFFPLDDVYCKAVNITLPELVFRYFIIYVWSASHAFM